MRILILLTLSLNAHAQCFPKEQAEISAECDRQTEREYLNCVKLDLDNNCGDLIDGLPNETLDLPTLDTFNPDGDYTNVEAQ